MSTNFFPFPGIRHNALIGVTVGSSVWGIEKIVFEKPNSFASWFPQLVPSVRQSIKLKAPFDAPADYSDWDLTPGINAAILASYRGLPPAWQYKWTLWLQPPEIASRSADIKLD